jgi:hypothetical protein
MPRRPLAEILAASAPCRELDDAYHFHVDVHGNYIPGLCTGLSIAVEDLGGDLSPAKYPHLLSLRENGVAELFEIAQGRGFVPRPDAYVSKCELCVEARAFLVNSARLDAADLKPSLFYAEYL